MRCSQCVNVPAPMSFHKLLASLKAAPTQFVLCIQEYCQCWAGANTINIAIRLRFAKFSLSLCLNVACLLSSLGTISHRAASRRFTTLLSVCKACSPAFSTNNQFCLHPREQNCVRSNFFFQDPNCAANSQLLFNSLLQF